MSMPDHSVALQKAACIKKEAKCPMTSRNVIARLIISSLPTLFCAINVTDFTNHSCVI